MTIYLIRHGKTSANLAHLYCGSSDLPLCAQGIQELEGRHYSVDGCRFISSGMRRCNETLRILFGDVPFSVEPRFREMDFGIFELHSYAQLKDTPAYQAWLCGDNEANRAPEGESGREMTARVLEAFAEIREDTLIVTHGGCIAAIMQHLFPSEGKSRYDWQPAPGCGYRLQDGRYSPL